ncbi:MAG: hypothetical protein RL150_215 [Candidatus Parcubacteria bacterium]|jgi:hypothetical protein
MDTILPHILQWLSEALRAKFSRTRDVVLSLDVLVTWTLQEYQRYDTTAYRNELLKENQTWYHTHPRVCALAKERRVLDRIRARRLRRNPALRMKKNHPLEPKPPKPVQLQLL